MAITRHETSKRMSQCVIHGDTVYLAGQVANNPDGDVVAQTKEVVGKIDALLAKAGTDKTKLLSAIVYLSDIRNFDAMNSVWDTWVAPGNPPARACVQALLAGPKYLVEISIVAAH
jgi:enamine deaminase RidA (YjgF/YER057c/UK114 family)